MRLLARLIILSLALFSVASVAMADKPDAPPGQSKDKGEHPQGGPPGQNKDWSDHPNGGPPGRDKVDGEHPLGGAPGQAGEAAPSLPLPKPGPPRHPEHSTVGETVSGAANAGAVRVKAPGGGWVELAADAPLPVGTAIDATEGVVEITAEAVDGAEQNAVVYGGVFKVEQDAGTGVTDLVLDGEELDACDASSPDVSRAVRPRHGIVAWSARSRRSRRSARRSERRVRGSRRGSRPHRVLWASGHGKFRTKGRYGVASVRGTRWLTIDRCDSTTVKVYDGVVDVYDEAEDETVTLRAGDKVRIRKP